MHVIFHNRRDSWEHSAEVETLCSAFCHGLNLLAHSSKAQAEMETLAITQCFATAVLAAGQANLKEMFLPIMQLGKMPGVRPSKVHDGNGNFE